MRTTLRHLALIALAAATLPAAAQFARPEQAIKYRQSVMSVQSTHFGRVAAMASGRLPYDAKAVAENTAVVETMIALPFTAFVDGSDKGNTRAKPEIWAERDNFMALAKKAQDEVAKLGAAARAGNQDGVKAAAGAVGAACKACHDKYQKE